MADILVRITDVRSPGGGAPLPLIVGNFAVSESADIFYWTMEIPWTASAAAFNSACMDAAILAAEDLGFTIGTFDTKRLIGGSAGLL